MMIEQSLHSANKPIFSQLGRDLQEHRLAEASERAAALQQPPHNRGQWQRANADVPLSSSIALVHLTGHGRQSLNTLMLKNISGSNEQPRPPRPANQLYGADAVAPKLKEVVLDPYTSDPEGLGKKQAQELFPPRARSTPTAFGCASKIRSGQRLAIQLAVGSQRQSIQQHDGCRHHVLGQTFAKIAPQDGSISALTASGHNVAHQTLLAGAILSSHNSSLANRAMAQQDRFNHAGLNTETPDLDLLVGP